MRDLILLAATLRAIRRSGGANRAPAGQSGYAWLAGSAPLNGQAVQDLIEDGWLILEGQGTRLVVDAWPSFAGYNPAPPMSLDSRRAHPERVVLQAEVKDE